MYKDVKDIKMCIKMSQILRQKWDILPKMERVRQKWDTFETAILNEKLNLKIGVNSIMFGVNQKCQEVLSSIKICC